MPYRFETLTEIEAITLLNFGGDPLLATEMLPLDPTIRLGLFDENGMKLSARVRRFLAGDHWQGGDGWVGPKPSNTTRSASDTEALSLISEKFVSSNMIDDVVVRHVTGVVGREPAWDFTPMRPISGDEEPTPEEKKMMDAASSALTSWWDKRHCHQLWQRAATEVLLSGRAVLRIYVPTARLQELPPLPAAAPATTPAGPRLVGAARPTPEAPIDEGDASPSPARGILAATLEEALDHIFVEVVTSEFGTVFTDADSADRIGVVVYRRQGDTPGVLGPRVVETSFLGGRPTDIVNERPTILRLASDPTLPAVPLPMYGRLWHQELVRPPLITEQIVSLQKALNLALSMAPRNVETSGFLERILLNAQLPGHWEVDSEGRRTGRFIPSHYVTGAGTTQFVQGVEIDQPEGGKTVATPSVQFRPPSPLQPTVDAIEVLTARILHDAKQSHILGTDQAQSGISRSQARADFEKSLTATQSAIEPAGRWLLETVLCLACQFASNDEGVVAEDLRAEFNCLTDTGPLDPAEKTAITDAVSKGFLSVEWGQQALGVEDTAAESARLNAEPGKRIALRMQLLDALKKGTDAGLSMEAAATLAGFAEDDIKLIAKDALLNPVAAPLPGMVPAKNPDGTPVIDPTTNQPKMVPIPGAPPPAPPPAPGAKQGAPPGGAAPPARKPFSAA